MAGQKSAPTRRLNGIMPLGGVFPVAVIALAAGLAVGQPAPKPIPAPTLTALSPAGIRRGLSAEIVLKGKDRGDLVGLWTTLDQQFAARNGEPDPSAKIVLPIDARIGPALVRLATANGFSAARLLAVDAFHEIASAADNKTRKSAQVVSLPCVVSGQIDAESSRFISVTMEKAGRLCVDVLARRLGSPLDPMLLIHDLKTGNEVPGGVRDDTPGLSGDCRLGLELSAGQYLVEIRDGTYRGGADFTFRLRLGDFPLATATVPMAVQRGRSTAVRFAGAGCDSLPVVDVLAGGVPCVRAEPSGINGQPGWPVVVLVSDFEERVEHEPNGDAKTANDVTVPGGITGQFDKPSDRDWYRFTAKKGEKLRIAAWAAEVGSPADVLLTVRDAMGKELAASDPQKVPPVIEFNPPADGPFFVVAEHVNYLAGPDEVYRVTVVPVATAALSITDDLRLAVIAGGQTEVKVKTARAGFDDPIALRIVGPTGLSGEATVAKGQGGETSITLKAASDLAPGVYTVRVLGTAGGTTLFASAKGALAGLPQTPPDWACLIPVLVTAAPKPEPKADP